MTMINPQAPLTSEATARTAARASAVAIFLGVVWGAVGAVYLMTAGSGVMDAAMAQAAAQNPDAAMPAGAAGALTTFAVVTAWVMVVIQLILGIVQWAKPNIFIPILFLVLVVYGLGTTILSFATMGDNPAAAAVPMWQIWVGLVILAVQALLHIVGIRGASTLNKFRRGEIESTDPAVFG